MVGVIVGLRYWWLALLLVCVSGGWRLWWLALLLLLALLVVGIIQMSLGQIKQPYLDENTATNTRCTMYIQCTNSIYTTTLNAMFDPASYTLPVGREMSN